MKNIVSPCFFLGANTPGGFYSLYSDFTDTAQDRLFILKGGPGCGKSTFMKRLGAACEAAGHVCEYIRCSGDPDSLDGLYVPDLHTGYVDGTSPHVIEPRYAGAQAVYVNMGAFYDLSELSARREEIARLTDGYKAMYDRAFRLLSGAAALCQTPALPEDAMRTFEKRAAGIIKRELKPGGHGGTKRRFLSAFTCNGPMVLDGTVSAMAERIYLLDNELGLGTALLAQAQRAAGERGVETISCRSPMFPEVTEYLIFPGLGLALVTSSSLFPYEGPVTRRLRLDAIPDRGFLSAAKAGIRRRARLRAALVEEATLALAEAKSLHDRLEAQYIPTVDFSGIDRLTQRHIEAFLG